MKIKSCIDCTERYLGCHDHCEKYQAEKAAHNEIKKKAQKEARIESCISQTKARIYWRLKKGHRR